MRKGRKIFRWLIRIFGVLIFLLLLFIIYLLIVSKTNPPKIADTHSIDWHRAEPSPGFYTLKNNWLRKSKSGLYELYVEGRTI